MVHSSCIQDSRVRDTVLAPSQESQPENKLLTICYGNVDMVNVNFINFASLGREVDKVCVGISLLDLLDSYHGCSKRFLSIKKKSRFLTICISFKFI